MFNFIKKLFTPKLSQIDKLIQFFGVESLSIWNGMNYCGEYMIPVTGRKPKDWKDPAYRWIKIGFGQYVSGAGDWAGGADRECCSIIEVWIDRDLNIMRVNRNHPYFNGSPHRNEKLIDKLYDKMLDVRKFSSGHQKLNDWIGTLFKATPRSLYAHPINYTGITTTSYSMLDHVLERLEEEEEKLAKEEKWLAECKHGEEEERLKAMKQDQSHDPAAGAEQVPELRTAPSSVKEEDDVEAMFGIEHKKEKKGKKKRK